MRAVAHSFSWIRSILELLNMAPTQCTASLCNMWTAESDGWRKMFYSTAFQTQLWHWYLHVLWEKHTQTGPRSASSACRFCSLLTPFLQTVEFGGPQWPLSACHATPPLLCSHPSFLMGIVETVELPCCHGSKHFHIFPTLPAQCATTKLEDWRQCQGSLFLT